MPISQRVINDSLQEVKAIFQWLTQREAGQEIPTTVLVGGWAVYTYNQYYGSIDIDLITNTRTKRSLQNHLEESRGYVRRRDDSSTSAYVCKEFAQGEIVSIDFASRNGPNHFEGRSEEQPLSMIDNQTVYQTLEDIDIPVPTRSFLLLMKIKAAWDRKYRLDHGQSGDYGWEHGKLVKDYSDILALSDPNMGGNTLDLNLLGSEMARLPFLRPVFDEVKQSTDAREKYRIEQRDVVAIIDRITSLIY